MRSVLAFLLASSPALAVAQSAVVIVPEVAVEPDLLERARAGAIEALAERGVRLVRAPDGEPCDDEECAADVAARAGADYVALVLVEAREDGGRRVRARLVRASGEPRDATADVGDAGIADAAAAAVAAALDAGAAGGSGFLMVRTRPVGAAIEIDGERAGESPLRRMVSAGEHTVRVVPERGAPRVRRVTVRALEETALSIDLAADDEPERASAGPVRTEPSPFNWILGGALAIGGVLALVSPLQTLATEGECVQLIEDVGCFERVQFGPRSAVLLGVGLAALTAAVIVDAVAPIRVAVRADATSATMRLEARF